MSDSSGRQSPKVIEGAQEELAADLVIEALGFDPEEIPNLFSEPGLEVSKWGTIKSRSRNNGEQILRGVFAAGDIVRGASLVVWAIRDGRDAAQEIDKYLKIKIQQAEIRVRNENLYLKNKDFLERNHIKTKEHDACGVGFVASTRWTSLEK